MTRRTGRRNLKLGRLRNLVPFLACLTCFFLAIYHAVPPPIPNAPWHVPLSMRIFAGRPRDPECMPFDDEAFRRLKSRYVMADSVVFFRSFLRKRVALETSVFGPPRVQLLEVPLLSLKAAVVVNATIGLPHDSELGCDKVIDVPIARPVPAGVADLSPFLFGLVSSMNRFDAALPHLQRFLTRPVSRDGSGTERRSNGAGLIVVLNDTTEAQNVALQKVLKATGINGLVEAADKGMSPAEQHFQLVPRLLQRTKEDRTRREWIALIDDDTFFPAPARLAEAFEVFKKSRREKLLVSGWNEPISKLRGFELPEISSGGTFLSIPAAEQLMSQYKPPDPAPPPLTPAAAPPVKIEEPRDPISVDPKYADNSLFGRCMVDDHLISDGPKRIRLCFYRYTLIKNIHLEGLHQYSTFGSPHRPSHTDGLMQSDRLKLGLHGWTTHHSASDGFVGLSSLADTCGTSCLLQRWVFPSNENGLGHTAQILPPMLLTNGYSLALYPQGMRDFDWRDRVEATYEKVALMQPEDDLLLGGMYPRLEDEVQKSTWRFLGNEGGYVVKGLEGRGTGSRSWYGHEVGGFVDQVAELVWLP